MAAVGLTQATVLWPEVTWVSDILESLLTPEEDAAERNICRPADG